MRVKEKSGVSYHFHHNQIQIKVKTLKHNYINNYASMVVNANSLVTIKKIKKLSYYYWHCTQHSHLECDPTYEIYHLCECRGQGKNFHVHISK